MDEISEDTEKISKSLQILNERLKVFSETFSSNQGLRLTEKQQKLLAAFEFLNRAEQRLANLQKHKIELTEKLSSVRVKLADIEEKLRPESVDRSVAMRGTTNAEELRDMRRTALYQEQNQLFGLVNEIQSSIMETEKEIVETTLFLSRIRQRIFPEIEKELLDL
ncbi:MAG: hypothetical protein R2747_04855 [Pyrinomonadaceae bacterium]